MVVTGSDLPCLTSIANLAPDDIVGFRYDGAQWVQIPIQVDEVLVAKIEAPWGPNGCRGSKKKVAWDVPFYADAQTFIGSDPDPDFDTNDELAFMARDAGPQLTSCVAPPTGTAGDPCELALQDPTNNAVLGYIYLFQKSGNLDPGAGVDLVSYDFGFGNYDMSDYIALYDECNGQFNMENSAVSSANYFLRFTGRWTESELKINAPGANGSDILDRHQAFITPGNCNRTEEIFSATNGPIIATIDGPVRAIRSVMGAVSGAYVQLDISCSEYRVDYDFDYRLHSISGGGGFNDVFDLDPVNASGMQFYSDGAPNGVTINGQADVVPTTYSTWQMVTGAPGSIVAGFDFDTDMSIGTPSQQGQGLVEGGVGSYYDDAGSNGNHLCTGDNQAFGSSGFFLTTDLCTDRKHGGIGCGPNVRYFSSTRSHYYLSPGVTPAQAQSYAEFARNPISVTGATLALGSLCGGSNYTVSTNSAPSNGGTTAGGGTFASGSSVTVTATPASGFVFSNWTEGGNVVSNSASYSFTLNGNRNLVANFTASTSNYTVSTSSAPSNGGTTAGGGTFASGSSVTVTATPASGFVFSNWTEGGNVVSNSASYSFTLNGNRNLVANFTASTSNYTVSTSSAPSNGGTTAGGGTFASGSSVTVTATPASGFVFSNWTEGGSVVSNSASYTFTLSGNRNLVANFSSNSGNTFDLTLIPKPSNGGTVSGAGTYPAGTQVTATATPASGYVFQAWVINGAVQSTNPVYSFQLNNNRKLKAKFILGPSSKQSLPEGDRPTAIQIFPNPSSGSFQVTTSEPYTLRVSNALGQVVYENLEAATHSTFDLSRNGIYLVEFWRGDVRVARRRIVVQQ